MCDLCDFEKVTNYLKFLSLASEYDFGTIGRDVRAGRNVEIEYVRRRTSIDETNWTMIWTVISSIVRRSLIKTIVLCTCNHRASRCSYVAYFNIFIMRIAASFRVVCSRNLPDIVFLLYCYCWYCLYTDILVLSLWVILPTYRCSCLCNVLCN